MCPVIFSNPKKRPSMQIAGILHKPQFLFVFCNVSYLNLTPQGGPLSVINGVIVPINGLICNWGYFAFIISGVISPYLSLVFGPTLLQNPRWILSHASLASKHWIRLLTAVTGWKKRRWEFDCYPFRCPGTGSKS